MHPIKHTSRFCFFVCFAFVCMNVFVSLGMDTVHACCNVRVLLKGKVLTSYRVCATRLASFCGFTCPTSHLAVEAL